MSNPKKYRGKKKCPDCDWGRLSIIDYGYGELVYDCHSCGYNKTLTKRDKEKEGLKS